jgi:hypothetical protein
VHLPTHLIEPAGYELPAGLHLPVFEDLSAFTKVFESVKSPITPFPMQSKACAFEERVVPVGTLIIGELLAVEL